MEKDASFLTSMKSFGGVIDICEPTTPRDPDSPDTSLWLSPIRNYMLLLLFLFLVSFCFHFCVPAHTQMYYTICTSFLRKGGNGGIVRLLVVNVFNR